MPPDWHLLSRFVFYSVNNQSCVFRRESWPSGRKRRLMFRRSQVRISALDTRWTVFHNYLSYCCLKIQKRIIKEATDPTYAMIGGDNSQTRSPWGVQVKRLTKIYWHLICSPIHPRLLGQGRFKPCLRPGNLTALWRPACCWHWRPQ